MIKLKYSPLYTLKILDIIFISYKYDVKTLGNLLQEVLHLQVKRLLSKCHSLLPTYKVTFEKG